MRPGKGRGLLTGKVMQDLVDEARGGGGVGAVLCDGGQGGGGGGRDIYHGCVLENKHT